MTSSGVQTLLIPEG